MSKCARKIEINTQKLWYLKTCIIYSKKSIRISNTHSEHLKVTAVQKQGIIYNLSTDVKILL